MVRQPKPGDSLPEHSPWIFDEEASDEAASPAALDVERLREAFDQFDLIDYRRDPHGILVQDPASVIEREYARLSPSEGSGE